MPIDIVYLKSLIVKLESDLDLLKDAVKEIEKKQQKKEKSRTAQKEKVNAQQRAEAWYRQYVKPQTK